MNEKRFTLDDEENGLCRCILVDGEEMPTCEICDLLNEQQITISALKEENEQLRNELTFLNKVISFFANNPMTKYSSKSELLEEMELLAKMGLI